MENKDHSYSLIINPYSENALTRAVFAASDNYGEGSSWRFKDGYKFITPNNEDAVTLFPSVYASSSRSAFYEKLVLLDILDNGISINGQREYGGTGIDNFQITHGTLGVLTVWLHGKNLLSEDPGFSLGIYANKSECMTTINYRADTNEPIPNTPVVADGHIDLIRTSDLPVVVYTGVSNRRVEVCRIESHHLGQTFV